MSTFREQREALIRASVSGVKLHELANSTVGFWPLNTGGPFRGNATAVTWIPTGHLVVCGDFDTVVFGRAVGVTPMDYLRELAAAKDRAITHAAIVGMQSSELVFARDHAAAKEDVEALREQAGADDETQATLASLVRAGRWSEADRIVRELAPVEIGSVVSARVIRAHELLVQLHKLVGATAKPEPVKAGLRLV